MSGLQHVLEQATPGPWIMRPTSLGDWKIQSPAGGRITPHIGARGHYNMSDAALIALAPDMARLLIEMAAWVDTVLAQGAPVTSDWQSGDALLARFAELDRRAADASR